MRTSSKQKTIIRERRKSKRLSPKNLKAIEVAGDYIYAVRVKDLSETGVLLVGHLMTESRHSELTLSLSPSKKLSVTVEALYDRIIPVEKSKTRKPGTAYRFKNLSTVQKKSLREFLSKLK